MTDCLGCNYIETAPVQLDDGRTVCATCPDYLEKCRDRCITEWAGVNDPPCHPGDENWKPCDLCKA